MYDWIYGPLALYGLLSLSLLLSLVLFATLKLELGKLASRAGRERQALEAETAAARAEAAALREALAGIENSLRELERATEAMAPPPPTRSGLNLTMRSQALRRFRLGEDPAAIAASLGLPLTEVDLLIKVNRLVLENL
jgi:hypothetical protein